MRIVAMILALGLVGCISESDELDPVNDQGERVSGATSSLNGFGAVQRVAHQMYVF